MKDYKIFIEGIIHDKETITESIYAMVASLEVLLYLLERHTKDFTEEELIDLIKFQGGIKISSMNESTEIGANFYSDDI